MPRHAVRKALEVVARASAVCLLLLSSCGDDSQPGDGGDAEDVYVRCNEEMCTAGNMICCPGAEPGTWDSRRMGCVCPTHADADADGDGDVTPDTTPDVAPDVEPDATPDAVPDVEPDTTPDVAPDVEPDAAPDVTAD